jgi:hypothetical protein
VGPIWLIPGLMDIIQCPPNILGSRFDGFITLAVVRDASKRSHERLKSLLGLPIARAVTTALAERQICHYRACREAELSLPILPRARYDTTGLAGSQSGSDNGIGLSLTVTGYGSDPAVKTASIGQ